MTGNGKHTTYKHGDDWGMVYDCFNHIRQDYKLVKRGVIFVSGLSTRLWQATRWCFKIPIVGDPQMLMKSIFERHFAPFKMGQNEDLNQNTWCFFHLNG